MSSLFLIDGHNVLYRTFFGVPRLSSPDGTPTNVVLGVARILLRILKEDRPAAIAAAFDTPQPTPRHEIFPEYKANRLKIPEDLLVQIPLVKEVIDALGVRRIEHPGAEADDIIGTLAREAEENGMDVVIVSSDKDLYQLVSPRVRVRDGLKERTVGEKEVREVFGVGPDRVADLLALAGDPSDNVPGIPGIGEKTAAELIREFGTLEELLAHADRLKGSRREKIEKNADTARLCKKLMTIDRRLPLEESMDSLAPRPMDGGRVAHLFRKLGFRKLLEDLSLAAEPMLPLQGAAPSPKSAWRIIGKSADLFPGRADGGLESASIAPGKEGFCGVSARNAGTFVIPDAEVPGAVRRLGRLCPKTYIFDGKSLLRGFGAPPGEVSPRMFDLQVAGYLLSPDEGTPTLSKLFARHLPEAAGAGGGETPEDRAAESAEALLSLGEVLQGKLDEAELTRIFLDVDMPLLPVLCRMEDAGIRIAPEIFGALSGELAAGTREIERKVAGIAGTDFNINSPRQLAFLLFEKLGLPPVKKTKTGYSTDVEVLEHLKNAHEIPALVLDYRTLAKIKSTYVDVLPGMVDPADGRIHTTLNQTQAATGRLSSSDPNLQNIPIRTELGMRIRTGFVAEPGWSFVGADYSQVELRLLAHLSGDAELTRGFLAGEDIHTATACGVFGVSPSGVTPDLRRRAKVINFGILYGMSAFGLSRELGIGGKEAKQYIDQYFRRFPGVLGYIEEVKERARKDGFVRTILGRRRYIRDINSQNKVLREAAERMAVNAPIQGSAADIIKLAMIRIDREFREGGMRARLVLQVHDELIAEAPDKEAEAAGNIVRDAMVGAASLSVPLTVTLSRGKNWGEIH
ncbi:MAG: DNA polymerase I [Deltaproteobacteria bacterium]|nr:DNA polymerase I [Deltaproteobacteria bacterium]